MCNMSSAPKSTGYWLQLTAQEAARVVNVQDFAWPDGTPDVNTDEQTESFNFLPFLTQRYRYGFRIGQKAEQQAVWPIVEQHSQIKAAQCMTAKTVRMLSVATTASNWTAAGSSTNTANLSADHTGAASTISGGMWDKGTATEPWIKIGLGYIADLVNQDTLGVVDSDPERFHLIINPYTARKMAASAELHQFIANSFWAKEEIEKGAHPNGKYGLPSSVYGYGLCVENCVRVTSRKGANLTKSYVIPNGNGIVASRPGDLDGVYGAPSFSTLTMFWYKDEMTVETRSDSWNRLVEARVVEDAYEVVTCPASGYYLTGICS